MDIQWPYLTEIADIETRMSSDAGACNKSSSDRYDFACVDLAGDSALRTNIFNYYRLLDLLVRDCKLMRKESISHLSPNHLKIYQIVTKFVSFYYDVFNRVLDLPQVNDLLIEIVAQATGALMEKYNQDVAKVQRLWKKGPLRNPEKVIKSYHDQYLSLIGDIRSLGIGLSHLIEVKTQIDAVISSSPNRDILIYIFGSKLWLHSHYLDHLQNIYYFLKNQGQFEITPGTRKYFCFMQDRKTKAVLNGMLVHKNDDPRFVDFQEHVFIHHSLYGKIFASVPVRTSMYLHSYAIGLFGSKFISVFPLAVMYWIFMSYHREGVIEAVTHTGPPFPEIPPGFIYQPLVTIAATERLKLFWSEHEMRQASARPPLNY